MTVIDLHTLKQTLPPYKSVLCLGNFDGVHIGHRALVSEALAQKARLAKEYPDVKCGAWFFGRAPHDIILNQSTPKITDLDQKLEIFSELGLDLAFIYDYEDIGQFSPSEFVHVLKKDCGCIFAVCGYNFKFGKNAAGDASLLSSLMGGAVSVVKEVCLDGKKVCSSEIRNLIADGKIEEVNLLLGRSYSIHGAVLHGKQLGRKLGIPTVNQALSPDMALLKKGIYVTRTFVGDSLFPSVSNVGIRPSVEKSTTVNCETYIIGFDGDLYGKDVKVEFLKRLRDEQKFDSVELLKAQINQDIDDTKNFFRSELEA